MKEDATNAFLHAIVPQEYALCIARERSFPDQGRPKLTWRHQFASAKATVAREKIIASALLPENKDTNHFFGVGGYDSSQKRKAENVKGIKSLILDVDIGKGDGFFSCKSDVIPALIKLLHAVPGLPAPWMVDSGNGIHIYFELDKTLTTAQWGPIAALFADVVRAVAPKLIADPVRTRDAASVMRLPGSYNAKKMDRLPVSVVRDGTTGKVDEVRAGLAQAAATLNLSGVEEVVGDELIPGTPPPSYLNIGVDMTFGGGLEGAARQEFSDLNLRPILKGCKQMREIAEVKGNVPEPQWVNFLRVLNTVKKADDAAVFFSSGHPTSSPAATIRKLRHIRTNFGSATAGCKEFRDTNPSGCFNCPHAKQVWTPSQLGVLDAQVKEMEAAIEEAAESAVSDETTATGYIAQPTTVKQDVVGARRRHVTSLPVRQAGKDGRYVTEPVINGHINLVQSSAMLQVKVVNGRDVDTFDDVRVHMDVEHDDGVNRVVCTTADLTHSGFDSATAVLRAKGLIFESGSKGRKDAANDYLRQLAKLANTKRAYFRPVKGWLKPGRLGTYSFVAGARTYNPDDTVVENVTSAEHKGLDKSNNGFMERACNGIPYGRLDFWKRGMAIYNGDKHELAQLLLLSGLSNLLLPLLSNDKGGIVLSLVGVSGKGKTTLMKFMSSFMGAHDKYVVSGSSTENAIGMLLQQANCMMLNVDDTVAKDGEMFSHLLAMVSGGAGKMRMVWDGKSGLGSVPMDDGYNTSLLLTSNFSTAASIGRGQVKGQMQVEAARSRTLEFPADSIRVLASDKPLWDKATALCINNHGHAFDAFMRHVVRHQVTLQHTLVKREQEIYDRLKLQVEKDKVGQVRFWARFLAVSSVAAQIVCDKLNLLSWDHLNILAAGEALVADTVALDHKSNEDLVDTFWGVCTKEANPNSPVINFVTRSAQLAGWPSWHVAARQGRWGRSEWLAVSQGQGQGHDILPSASDTNQWRVDTYNIYDGKDLHHQERIVYIPITDLKSLVYREAGGLLEVSDWSDLYVMLRSAGCEIFGVCESRPDKLSKPPVRVNIGIKKHASKGFARSVVEIRLPPQFAS